MDKIQKLFLDNEDEIISGLDTDNEVGFVNVDIEEGCFELHASYETLAEWYGIEEYETDVFEKSVDYYSLDGLDITGRRTVGIAEQLEDELDKEDVKELIFEKVNNKEYEGLKLVNL